MLWHRFMPMTHAPQSKPFAPLAVGGPRPTASMIQPQRTVQALCTRVRDINRPLIKEFDHEQFPQRAPPLYHRRARGNRRRLRRRLAKRGYGLILVARNEKRLKEL